MYDRTINLRSQTTTRWASLPYVLPFAVFLALLAQQKYAPLSPYIEFTVRDVLLAIVLFLVSRRVTELRSMRRLETVIIGVAVFVVWVAPDVVLPNYRQHWLFQNFITGQISTTIPEDIIRSPIVLWPRIIQAVVLVPILEELFWRAWLMRWLINPRFESVPLGTYQAASFWITAVLFASEHGPYWDVGLIAGIAYNWWMVRTRSLGDCILAHAITNACLCGYVVATHHWEYWQ
ncbi:MAG TPA: CAAX prenyl protease-related protein [Bryobacteraceae bacterium]|nr:CAAX prenyl protease-related protein [Bryobacteraceae bacterium]